MNLLFKILLFLLSINFIKSDLDNSFCVCDKVTHVPILSRISGRIYNGRSAKKDELRYVGQIYNRIYIGKNLTNSQDPYGYSPICTGFLINGLHAITSGECASYMKENQDILKDTFFAVASHFSHLIKKARKDPAYYRQITEVFIHPEYDEKTLDKNIGVIKFKSPFILGRTYHIQAACLVHMRFNVFLEKLYTAGYGFKRIIKAINSEIPIYDTDMPRRLQVMSGLTINDCKIGKM